MCTKLLPPGGYPIAVKYIISYHMEKSLGSFQELNPDFSVILFISLYQLMYCNCFNNGFNGLTSQWQNIRKKIYLCMIQTAIQVDKVINP